MVPVRSNCSSPSIQTRISMVAVSFSVSISRAMKLPSSPNWKVSSTPASTRVVSETLKFVRISSSTWS